MPSIATEINRLIRQLDTDSDYCLKIARYNEAFLHAIENTCKDNADMAKEILKHTNAFYIRKDDTPKKGAQKDKPYIVCEICIDDPLVRSEVNLRREMIQYDLIAQGLNIDEIRIIPAKGGMKQRHPFSEDTDETKQKRVINKQNNDLSQINNKNPDLSLNDMKENLETVKRVLCRVFREKAGEVVDKINAVTFDDLSSKDTDKKRKRIYYRLHFYAKDSDIRELLEQNKRFIISVSYDFGLSVRYMVVHKAQQDMINLKAFPKNADPSPYVFTNKK